MKYFPVPQDEIELLNKDSLLSTPTSLLGECAFLARVVLLKEKGREEKPLCLFISVFLLCDCIPSFSPNFYTLPYF